MEKIALKVQMRTSGGKGPARRIRQGGGVPAVMYGQGSATPITINRRELVRILHSGGGGNALLSVTIEGGDEERLAIIKSTQADPIKNDLLHADLLVVTADRPIHVTVPVALTAETPKGVKEGGILQHFTRDILVECLPADIPDHITLDAAELGIGASVHVGDLSLPAGVKALTEPDKVVITIAAPISDEKLEAMLSVEAATEVKEPEVLKAKKEEAEEEEKKQP